ncbi:hypothetical protein ABZ646_44935, partial [Streptomyces sp. NPDC007162]
PSRPVTPTPTTPWTPNPIGRPQDAWLATWSRADAAVTLPVEPVEFAGALASLLRKKRLLSA